MDTLSIEIQQEALLQAVERLDEAGLDQFLEDVLALKAKRSAPAVPDEVASLLSKIGQLGLAEGERKQLHTLLAKTEVEILTPDERQTVIQFSDKSERLNAERITTVIELARDWQTPTIRCVAT